MTVGSRRAESMRTCVAATASGPQGTFPESAAALPIAPSAMPSKWNVSMSRSVRVLAYVGVTGVQCRPAAARSIRPHTYRAAETTQAGLERAPQAADERPSIAPIDRARHTHAHRAAEQPQ